MKGFTRGAVALLILAALSSTAHANPPTWSFARASFGIDGKGAIYNPGGDQSSAFLPGAYLSYSATSAMSLAGTYERDFARHLSIGQAGFRFLLTRSPRAEIAAGVNLVGYGDEGAVGYAKPTSWNASLNGAWSAVKAKGGQTMVWGIASFSYDPDNDLKTLRVGLRLQVVGGKPWADQTN